MVECTFGILSNKWRIFHTSMTIPLDFAMLVTKVAYVLHNFICAKNTYRFEDSLVHYFVTNPFRSSNRSTNPGRKIQDAFGEYFLLPAGKLACNIKDYKIFNVLI